MDQSPLSGAGEEHPLAPDQLRVGKFVCVAAAPVGESLAEGCANTVPGGPQRATPEDDAPGPAQFQQSTGIDPFRNSDLRINVN